MEYYSATKKNELSPFVTTWINAEGITVNEGRQTEKNKHHVISFTCAIKKMKPVTNKQPKSPREEQTQMQRRS